MKTEIKEEILTQDEYEKREKEIKALIIKLKVKLKRHKVDFKTNPKNWGYVVDLVNFIKVLKEII